MATLFRTGIVIGLLAGFLPSAWAGDDGDIERAVDRGVGFLKSQQRVDGTWSHEHVMGATALAALTLLECNVPANDPAVQNATEVLRGGSLTEEQTYDISLAILFFD